LTVVHGRRSTSSWSLPNGAGALAVEHADDAERQALQADALADRALASGRVVDDGLADEADLRRGAHVRVGEVLALDDGPLAHLEVRGVHPCTVAGAQFMSW
jgi:hypothetical protein